MLLTSLISAFVQAQEHTVYGDLRFAAILEHASLPAGSVAQPHIGPQRAILGNEWSYGDHEVTIGANLFEQFHLYAPEVSTTPQLWDAQWRYQLSEQVTLNAGRQPMPIGRSDRNIQSASVQPHSLSQLLGQSQFRADGFGFGVRSIVNVETTVSSIGVDMDGRAKWMTSARLSHVNDGHHHSLSLVYKGYSQDPYAILVIEQHLSSITVGISAMTGANRSQPFWGGEGRLSWNHELGAGAFETISFHERTAYLSPSGALRDLESRLQSDTSIELAHKGPIRHGVGYSLFYPINASIPIVHRASVQFHIDY